MYASLITIFVFFCESDLTVSGLVYAASGLCCTVSGLVYAASGLCCTVSGSTNTVSGLGRTVNGSTYTVSSVVDIFFFSLTYTYLHFAGAHR
jgi:hypothetical protein